jgi:hypothetical protein
MASDLQTQTHGPDEEFFDSARQSLIDRLNRALTREAGGVYHLMPEMWAALWLCDLGRLRERVESAESFGDRFMSLTTVALGTSVRDDVLKPCMFFHCL